MINHRILLATLLMAGDPFFHSQTRAEDPAPLPVAVSPADPAVAYAGRFDMRDSAAPRCEWPACMVTLKFSGTAINASFDERGHDFWQVEIDGRQTVKLELQRGAHIYGVASGLPEGEHIVTLTKATEGFVGRTTFLGFQLDAGAKTLPPSPLARRIEVIGDSISCGYGVEAGGPDEDFLPRTENARDAYGAIAAARLGAGYACIAYSGRKMWPDDTVPELYDRTLTNIPSLKWDFVAWIPDVVVINLGTNDFDNNTPDEALWIDAYRKFIARLRTYYPRAVIYCTTGPIIDDEDSKITLLSYVRKIVAAENAAGDAKIHALDFGQQSPENGFGANGHPSLKTQQIMAGRLVETLQRDMGWK
jgi:lysophospholipase L1-like esterase